MTTKRLVYICDWLPPDFGAVGQYALIFSEQWAWSGWDVTLVGLSSGPTCQEPARPFGAGSLEIVRIHRPTYKKQKIARRLIWTVLSNLILLKGAFARIRRSEAVLITGSPPLMLHFFAPLNLVLRKKLIYRITDFHPECLLAERGQKGLILALLLRLTRFWRRQVDQFEVLGFDQAKRLTESGIDKARIVLKRDPSPVTFSPALPPLSLPNDLQRRSGTILYSGNWGVAHDDNTFVEAYARYFRESDDPLGFWLNATGAKADRVEQALRAAGVPLYRSKVIPLADLPRLLLAADVHLITLRDAFVGYVLPSKVHACIESHRRILFVGSAASDVHLLASEASRRDNYWRIDPGDMEGLVIALHAIEREVRKEKSNIVSEAAKPSGA